MIRRWAIVISIILLGVLMSGCMSTPVKNNSTSNVTESQPKIRYVEINLLDGTKIGGKYVSETAAFTTIDVMYTMDPNAYKFDAHGNYVKDPAKYIVKGNGAEVAIKNSLINTVVTTSDPTAMIENVMQGMENETAALNKAADEKAAMYKIQAEQIAAEQAKHMPTKHA
jgi:hypothetical protein